jgi:hypothetical protein
MTWEDRLTEMISPTATKWAYRVIQLKPNKKKDTEIYTLSGREEDIAANGSLFLALYDLANKDRVDFEEWWEQWEAGFPLLQRAESNYQLSEWRKSDSRPRYREWQPTEAANKNHYRTIEYWRDRSNESESIILSGTDLQLIEHIIQIEYEGGGSAVGNSLSGRNSKPILKGWPAIVLNFREPNDSRRKKPNGASRSATTGEKTIRCAGYSDDRQIVDLGLAEMIKESDVRRWANKIKEEFATPLYRWEKGRGCLSYSGQIARMQGLEGYAYVTRAEQGKDLFAKLLRIFDSRPDPLGFKFSNNEEPEAFPDNPADFQLFGKSWEAEAERPRTTVVFDSALLYLPKLRSPIPLVKGSNVIYDT